MTHDPVPSPETLAQQAASWVPPWQRDHEDELPGAAAEADAIEAPEAPADVSEAHAEVSEAHAEVPEVLEAPAEAPAEVSEAHAEVSEAHEAPEVLEAPADVPEALAEAAVEAPEEEEPAEVPEAAVVAEAPGAEVPGAEPADAEPVAAEPEVAQAEPIAAVAAPASEEPQASTAKRKPAKPKAEPVVPAQAGAPAQEQAPEPMDERELISALEAILMVVDEPVGEILLAQVLEQPMDTIAFTLRNMSREYAEEGRGFDLRQAAGGWRFYTRDRYASYVERFVLDGQSVRLTQAALETLAVVAYKQPVTRSRISAIRGVNCDGVVRTLLGRGLIEEAGTEPESGAHLYRTTGLFLEKLGLDSVDQLPPLAPFLPDNVEEIADAER